MHTDFVHATEPLSSRGRILFFRAARAPSSDLTIKGPTSRVILVQVRLEPVVPIGTIHPYGRQNTAHAPIDVQFDISSIAVCLWPRVMKTVNAVMHEKSARVVGDSTGCLFSCMDGW